MLLDRLCAFKAKETLPAGATITRRSLERGDAEVLRQADAVAAPDLREESLCVICLSEPKTFLCSPCGHKCLCKACADAYRRIDEDGWVRQGKTECPLCRRSVKSVMRVWE